MPKKANIDDVVGIEKENKFHYLKFFFGFAAVYLGISWYQTSIKEEKIKKITEAQITYTTLENALSSPSLPRYEYSKLEIEREELYKYAKKGDLYVGFVKEDAEVVLNKDKEVGYLLSGILYNEIGRKAGALVGSRTGYDIYSFDKKKIGTIVDKKIMSLDGKVFGNVSHKTAVLYDKSLNLTGVIDGYDFSRDNKIKF